MSGFLAETTYIKWSIIMVIICLYINWMYKMFINCANKFILNVSDWLMLACVFIQMNFPVGLKMGWSIYWNKIEDYKNCFGNIILNWLAAFPLSTFIMIPYPNFTKCGFLIYSECVFKYSIDFIELVQMTLLFLLTFYSP